MNEDLHIMREPAPIDYIRAHCNLQHHEYVEISRMGDHDFRVAVYDEENDDIYTIYMDADLFLEWANAVSEMANGAT